MGATYPEGCALVPHPFSACPGGATVPEGGWRSIDSVCGDAVRPPPGVQVEATDAFRVRGLPSLPSSGQAIFGTQSAGCPKNYLGPQPVKAITLEPHKAGHWIARILLTVTAPGTYHFGRARITYELTGVGGWQYQDVGLVVRYAEPRRPPLLSTMQRDNGRPAGPRT